MLGYIKPFKPYMRMNEYNIYNGFYCGLCKNLGKNYGQLYRMLLSYDFAFLGLLCCSVTTGPLYFQMQKCIVHPIKRRLCLKNHDVLDFAASAAVISVYQKLCDTVNDTSFIKSLPFRLVKVLAKRGYKKACRNNPTIAEHIKREMDNQFRLEREGCISIDRACDPTGSIMRELAAKACEAEEQSDVFGDFGYHLGRFVYLADAYDDIEKDRKKNNYNVLLKYGETVVEARKIAQDNINMSLGMIAEYYSQMKICRFKEIIDNVIYLGLKSFSLPKKIKRDKEIIL